MCVNTDGNNLCLSAVHATAFQCLGEEQVKTLLDW